MAAARARGRQAPSSAVFSETKYFDTGFNSTLSGGGSDWTGTEVPMDNYVNSSGTAAAYTDSALVPSANGSGYGQVNGNRFKLKKIRVRGALSTATLADQADVSAPLFVRLMLVMDEQPNGAQAQGEDIMQDIGGDETIWSYKRVSDTSGRFRILKDEMLALDVSAASNDHATNSSTSSVGTEGHFFSFQYQPRQPILCNIKSGNATPTVAGLVNCNIFLVLMGTRGGTVSAVTIRGASRAYYID